MNDIDIRREPYPPLDGTTKNCRLACELGAARAHELWAISEYIYQSIMFAPVLPRLSELFDEIAMDEMRHFRLLGELILRLGGDPSLRCAVRGRGGIQTGRECDCRTQQTAAQTIEEDLRAEDDSRRRYLNLWELAERMGQLPAADLLYRIARDEAAHVSRLTAMAKDVNRLHF